MIIEIRGSELTKSARSLSAGTADTSSTAALTENTTSAATFVEGFTRTPPYRTVELRAP